MGSPNHAGTAGITAYARDGLCIVGHRARWAEPWIPGGRPAGEEANLATRGGGAAAH
jgi:hypothetical protein